MLDLEFAVELALISIHSLALSLSDLNLQPPAVYLT